MKNLRERYGRVLDMLRRFWTAYGGFSKELRESYNGVFEVLKRFWMAYGGLGSLIRSPYLHISFLLSLVMANTWLSAGWWDSPLGILPNLLGFTLGGYAILIGFGDEQFKSLMAGSDQEGQESPFLGVSAAFAHFIIVQTSALIFALLARSLYFALPPELFVGKVNIVPFWYRFLTLSCPLMWFLGYWNFVYSITLAFASALSIFRMSVWFDQHQGARNGSDSGTSSRKKEKDPQ